MRDVNRVVLVGRVARDPDISHTASGGKIAHLILETRRRLAREDGHEEEISRHWLHAHDRTAEFVAQHVRRGDRLYVEGRLFYDSFQKNGVTIPTTKIVTREIVLLNAASGGEIVGVAEGDE